ncbi:hypothetical protein CDD82_5981 [Ophiocordyceps australis]|uniref:Uncharacterized protein n=1 Tax=Ophiocordyceps australis TaxID=1399860 RepID=A0A2C5YSC5_9HYPO|nr:hypothetical protein CDD82_5981 [Ophiocordyceps australis]
MSTSIDAAVTPLALPSCAPLALLWPTPTSPRRHRPSSCVLFANDCTALGPPMSIPSPHRRVASSQSTETSHANGNARSFGTCSLLPSRRPLHTHHPWRVGHLLLEACPSWQPITASQRHDKLLPDTVCPGSEI